MEKLLRPVLCRVRVPFVGFTDHALTVSRYATALSRIKKTLGAHLTIKQFKHLFHPRLLRAVSFRDLEGRVTNTADQVSAEILRSKYDAGGRLTNLWRAANGSTYSSVLLRQACVRPGIGLGGGTGGLRGARRRGGPGSEC